MKNGFALDKLGIFCSTACAIHCFFAPLLIFISPTIARYLQSEWVHIGLVLLVVPIAVISFYSSKNLHQSLRPMRLGFLGLGFLVIAICYEQVLGLEVEGLEVIATAVGSAFLVMAHLNNMKCLRTYRQELSHK